jgi:hypothetical protein
MTRNQQRARRFQSSLRHYDAGGDLRETLVDLLADARHWCDRHDETYAKFDRQAYQHYLAELADQRGGSK